MTAEVLAGERSLRDLIVEDVVATIVKSGLVPTPDSVEDGEPITYEYPVPALPHVWVFESDEVQDGEKTTDRILSDLTIFIHEVFAFDSTAYATRMHTVGRHRLALYQVVMCADITRGGHAWLTTPAGNSIGEAKAEESGGRRGVLETRWRVRYWHKRGNPFRKA